MKIGIVCEGPTDFYAIINFIGEGLSQKKIDAEFVDIQPTIDNTRGDAGWAQVFNWLNSNPPQSRVKKYFGMGLFDNGLSKKIVDAIFIQIDSDIVEHPSFINYIRKQFLYRINPLHLTNSDNRALEIEHILDMAVGVTSMSKGDAKKHILCPAIESTEAWCVCVFQKKVGKFRELKDSDLINAFGKMMSTFQNQKQLENYSNINKDVTLRKRFCEKHRKNYSTLVSNFPEIEKALNEIIEIS